MTTNEIQNRHIGSSFDDFLSEEGIREFIDADLIQKQTLKVTKESLALAGLTPVLIRGGLHDDGEFTTDKTKFSVLAVDTFNNICCTILSDVSFEEGAEKVSELSSDTCVEPDIKD